MQRIMNILSKIEIWFFYGLLLTFTLSIRKVLFFYPIRGQFNEYAGIYLYLSDIFVLSILASWLLSALYNKIVLKSRYRIDFKLFLKQKVVAIPFLLVIFSFISIFWSVNLEIAMFQSIKLLEFYLLYLWVIFRIVPRGTIIFKNIFQVIIITGITQSIIGIWQFIVQKSVGLSWLWESTISPSIPGVAKIVLSGEKYIRAYGLFPHPNILGGFLILSIIFTILYSKQFHACPVARNCSTWNNLFATGMEHSKEELNNNCSTFVSPKLWRSGWNNCVCYVILSIQLVAIILTFSKSAWVGLAISLIYIWYQNVPRGTFVLSFKKIALGKMRYFALIAGILFSLIVIIKPNWYSMVGKGADDRMFYFNVSRGTFLEKPILGVGSGQFVLSLENIRNMEYWQFQPVHNVFLLILNELGIIGLFIFVWFIWRIIINVSSQHKRSTPVKMFHVEHSMGQERNILRGRSGIIDIYVKSIFLGFLFIMLVDHYFWDIQQGQIFFWLTLSMLVGNNMWIDDKTNTYPQDKANKLDK